jgi:transketolase
VGHQREIFEIAGERLRLERIATHIRDLAIDNITKTKSGHPGGSLSVTDILTALYFGRIYNNRERKLENVLRVNPKDPLWPGRDRVILSKGHAAPAFYATLATAGYFDPRLLKIYRKIDSPLEGHPAMYQVSPDGSERGTRGVDFSTGSLGHGLSVGAGIALHAKIYGTDCDVYVILSDGELQEGMPWEACMTMANKGLHRLCAFVDYNRLQVDGSVDEINSLEPLEKKFKAFNWEVKVVNGHDFDEILDVLAYFKLKRNRRTKPLMVIANTIKGKGIPEIEGDYRYHATPLTPEQQEKASKAFRLRMEEIDREMAHGSFEAIPVNAVAEGSAKGAGTAVLAADLNEIIARNPAGEYREPTATRIGYGNCLSRLGEYPNIFVLNADLAGACSTSAFIEKYPERAVNVGVQECNMMAMAAGIASCGKIAVANSFGIFSTGRAWEIVRQDISYTRLNVKIIGSHTGIALGEYGVSHQSIEDVGVMRSLPHIVVIEPSDAIQADRLFEKILLCEGPVYFRIGRNPTPLIYAEGNEFGIKPVLNFEIGKGILLREGEDCTIIASGPVLCEVLKVAQAVRESIQVIDMPTIEPVDEEIIVRAARKTKRIATVQDHYRNGGLGDAVFQVIAKHSLSVEYHSVALSGFAESGSPEDLYEKYGLSANRIMEQLGLKRRATELRMTNERRLRNSSFVIRNIQKRRNRMPDIPKKMTALLL